MKFSVLALLLVLFYFCQAQDFVFPDEFEEIQRQSRFQNYYPGPKPLPQPRNPTYQPNVGSRQTLPPFFKTFRVPLKDFQDKMSKGTTQLTLNLDKIMRSQYPNQNLVFSPLSLQMLLANILLASRGQTFDEISNIYNIDRKIFVNSEKNFHENFGKLIEKTFYSNKPGAPKVNYGTGVFLAKNDSYDFGTTFSARSEDFYKTHLETVDFLNGAQKIINNWVKSETRGLIPSILDSPPRLNTKAIIASALYFKGDWEKRFDHAEKSSFFINNNEITVNMMSREGKYKYYSDWNLKLDIISLPYEGSQVSMFVVIPKDKGTVALKNMKDKLTPDIIDKLIENMQETKLNIFLPKMDLSSDLDFTKALNNMGLRSLTDPDRADLSLLTSGERWELSIDAMRINQDWKNIHVYFDQIVQKVKLSVSEEGTEAAAVTGGLTFRDWGPQVVKADHPFLFFIRNNDTKSILFYGSIINPNSK
ncbi:hypothetical protein TKK_0008586 [Trichogramma kaykai]|uniref:Serpin domain-containing protein n=1 Tax=Trichogramma kaykai TaxID=54128 RepID=A0ABD2X7P5_9HYME